MATNNTTLEVLARIRLDEASAKKTAKGINAFEKDLNSTEKQVNRVAQSVEQKLGKALRLQAQDKSVDRLSEQFIRAAKESKNLEVTVQNAAKALEKLGATDAQINRVAENLARASANSGGIGGGRSTGERITAAGRALFNAPDVGGSTTVSRVLIGGGAAVDALDKVGIGIAQLGAIGLAAIPLIVGAGIVLKEFFDIIDAGQKRLDAAIEAQNNYYDALENSTSTQARELAGTLGARNAVLPQQIAETERALESAFAQAVARFGDPAARAMDAAGQLPTAQLREQLASLDLEYQTNIDTITRLEQGLAAGAFAANDAAEAERALSDLRNDAATRVLNAQIAAYDMDAEATNERIKALQYEVDQINAFREAGLLTGDALERLTARAADASAELDVLNRSLPARAAADLATLEGELAAERVKIYAKRDADIKKIEDAAAADEIELRNKIAGDLAEADIKAGQERVKLAEDIEKRRTKIERDFGRTALVALQNRDAIALSLAEMKKQDDLADLKDDGDQRSKEIDRQLKDQQRIINKRLTDQLAAQRAAAKAAVDLARQQARAEVDAKYAAAQAELTLLRELANTTITTSNQMLAMLGQVRAAFNQTVAFSPYGTTGVGTPPPPINLNAPSLPSGGGISYPRSIPQFASGIDYVPNDMIAKIHKGERILNARDAEISRKNGAGGVSISVNGWGMTPRQVGDEVTRQLEVFVRG